MDKISETKKYVNELNLQVYEEVEKIIRNYDPIEKQFKDINIGDIFGIYGQDMFYENYNKNYYVVVKKTKKYLYYEELKITLYHPTYDKEPICFNNNYIYVYDKNIERNIKIENYVQ